MTWTSPFSLPGYWFKGNLHCHTTQSDGLASPEEAVRWYYERGYDFLAITDHWVLTPGCPTPAGAPDGAFITITGTEIHGAGYHMLALGLSALPAESLADAPSEVAAVVRASGGLAFIAHPYWTGQSSAEVGAIAGIAGVEVFNAVCEKMDGLGYARVHWDDLLSQGRRLTGLSVDDTHWKHDSHGTGYVMVRAAALTEADILAAIAAGHFYSSTGPTIQDLRLVALADGRPALKVCCSPCATITFYTQGPKGRRFTAPAGEALHSAVLPLRREQVFVRVECADSAGRIAWSNAIMIEDLPAVEG
jgi:hypothetical protein